MDPILEDDLKRRKLLHEQVQEYIEQQSTEDKKATSVLTGPMAGRTIKQLETSAESTPQVPKTGTKGTLISDTCENTADKIDSNLIRKSFISHK